MNIKKILIAYSVKFEGQWDKIYEAISLKRHIDDFEVEELCATVKSKAITILDSNYPEYLRNSYKPPFVLFYYGDFSLISNPNNNIAIVGTREPSLDGVINTAKLARELTTKFNVVSGLAKGIDRIAHENTINSGGKTVAVLGCGIDICYPIVNEDLYKEIKRNHLLISEYPNSVEPYSANFPPRNRLIAIFAAATLITEAHTRSGTSITANFTNLCGHEVFCLPSSDLENSLCNELIKDGANLVRNADDIFYALGR